MNSIKLSAVLFFIWHPYVFCALLENGHLIGNEIVNNINNNNDIKWTAGINDYFGTNISIKFVRKSKLGLKRLYKRPTSNVHTLHTSDDELPENYDLRSDYPKCKTIGAVKDQSNCGSCWAVAIAGALSDRFCIKSNGTTNVNISSNHIISCDQRNYGCRGGYMYAGWNFTRNGVITGGEYESDEGCQPYSIRPCGNKWTFPCASDYAITPKCKKNRCTNDWYKHKAEPKLLKISGITDVSFTYYLKNAELIKREIYVNGTITAGFAVYSDFLYYKSGVYRRSWNGSYFLGYHAVKVIGWGMEKDERYWLAVNSWSDKWGNNGTFKIIRGENHCQFESTMHGGIPILD